MNEAAVQRKIIERFTKRGWLCVKLIQTTINGISDLMLLKAGRAVFIECKRPGGRVEPLQIYRQEQLIELGFKAYITDDPAFDFEKPFTKTLVKGVEPTKMKAGRKPKIKRND